MHLYSSVCLHVGITKPLPCLDNPSPCSGLFPAGPPAASMIYTLLALVREPPDDVWFSRDIYDNQLRAWVLVTKRRRYELVRMAEGDYVFVCDYDPRFTLYREGQRQDRTRRGGRDGFRNRYDNWIMVVIGWSHLSGGDIDRCFDAVRAYYPPRLSWTQCQDFLRRFADQFIDRYHIHWRFFVDNTAVECRCVPQLPPIPAAIQNPQAQTQEQARFMSHVQILNQSQAGYFAAQQQNMAMNQQIQQNSFNPGYGF